MGDPISARNLDGGGRGYHTYRKPDGESHICKKHRCGGSHICRKPRWGDPISAENLHGGADPLSAGNLDGGRDLISAGNLDLGSHTYRKPRCGGDRKPTRSHMRNPISPGNLHRGWGIPNLQETYMGESHMCRKPRGRDPISTGNLDVEIPYLQEARRGIPYLQET